MRSLNRGQKEKVCQFKTVIPGTPDKVAIDCLRSSAWMVEPAIEHYFQNAAKYAASSIDTKKLEALYEKYKDQEENLIRAQGVMDFCQELGVDPSDPALVVISFHMKAATMSEFTKDEFVNGMAVMGVDSTDKLRGKLDALRHSMSDSALFSDLYNWAYGWACEKGQKCLQLDMALALWGLLFQGPQSWELLDEWCTFLKEHHKRAIIKDTWTQLLQFRRTVRPDMSNFDEAGAWPVLIDEFVEYMNEQQGAMKD